MNAHKMREGSQSFCVKQSTRFDFQNPHVFVFFQYFHKSTRFDFQNPHFFVFFQYFHIDHVFRRLIIYL